MRIRRIIFKCKNYEIFGQFQSHEILIITYIVILNKTAKKKETSALNPN